MSLVRDLLADLVEVRAENITVHTDVFSEFDVDSLQMVELMAAVEQRLSVHLESEELMAARTVTEIADGVVQRLPEGHPADAG